METGLSADIAAALAEPFEITEIKWKPQVVKGNRAMATVYIDARLVMDRLDDVFGVGGWQDEYTPLGTGSVMCRLSVRVGEAWVVKTDVGSPSEQPDEGDRTKAAFSDALKRAAVKLGVGRYLYRIGSVWHDYDPVRKQFASRPPVPAWALPKPQAVVRRLPDAAPYAEPEPIPLTHAGDGPKALPAKTAKPKAEVKSAADVYAALSNVTIEDGAKLARCFAATADKLAQVADYPAADFRAALAGFLKLDPNALNLATLPAKDHLPAWNFVKQTVKRFADAQANPQPQQAP